MAGRGGVGGGAVAVGGSLTSADTVIFLVSWCVYGRQCFLHSLLFWVSQCSGTISVYVVLPNFFARDNMVYALDQRFVKLQK